MLTIVGPQPSDAGAYACVAVNEPGNAMQQATLTVHGKLHRHLCICTGSNFSVLPDIQWFRISPSLWMVWCTLLMRHTQ